MRKSDYRAPSLHPNARDTRKTRAAAAAAAAATTTKSSSSALAVDGPPATRTTADNGGKGEDEEDVMRLPESSSDEDNAPEPANKISNTSKAKTSSKRKLDEREKLAQPQPLTRQSKRARRQKLQDTKPDLRADSNTTDDDLWGNTLPPPSLSASQRESLKLKRVYTSSARKKEELKTFKPDIKTVGEEEEGDEQGTGRRLEIKKPPPPLLEESAARPQPELKLGRWQTQEEKQEKEGREEGEEEEAQPEFKTYSAALEPFSPPSSTLSSTDAHLKGSPTSVSRPSRSQSSLSSLGSLSPSQEYSSRLPRQKAGNNNHDKTTTDIVCTMCRKVFSVTLLQDRERNMKSLSLQSQRDICHRHRLAEAQEVSRDRGYPAAPIDWAEVEGVRIPKLLTHLRRVLQRKTPSFYLEQLDSHAAAAKKSKPKLLRMYLHSGVFDVVKTGYYGPKGQKVVCDAVTIALARDLKQASRDDDVVSAAGVGAYVAAVLAPECTMRLVMEDLNTRSQDWARDVLAESSDIGRLLNPDDDRIEIVDGE